MRLAGPDCANCGVAPWQRCVCDVPEPDDPAEVCAVAGCEWADAGGGLLVCLRCDAEKWA